MQQQLAATGAEQSNTSVTYASNNTPHQVCKLCNRLLTQAMQGSVRSKYDAMKPWMLIAGLYKLAAVRTIIRTTQLASTPLI
jgi:hypothetical protein